MPDVDITIATKNFLLNNFYSNKFRYLEFPSKAIENPQRVFWLRLLNRLIREFSRAYPLYVARAGKYDLMHSHFAFAGWEYRNIAKRLHIPHIISFYGFDYEFLPFTEPIWNSRYAQLFRDADLFLCEGAHGASILQAKGCPKGKIRIAKLGVNVEQIPFWKRKKARNHLKLLQISAFKDKKGHKYCLEAFLNALTDCPNMSLTFVGADVQVLKQELQQRVANSNAKNKVFFHDPIDFDHLHSFMKDYHVFIHPSNYTDERDCEGGAPVVLLDAQATGMPVISTTHCDIPDEVLHGKTGLLSPEKDTFALSKSIHFFYFFDQIQYDIFAENSRKHVENNYDVRENSAKIRMFYDEVLSINR
jgi:colanic acid/amylovoran biosynthesis glycosyltransferase